MVKLPSKYSIVYRRIPAAESVFDMNFQRWIKMLGYPLSEHQDEFLATYSAAMGFDDLEDLIPELEPLGLVYRRDYVFALNADGIIGGCPSWLEEVRCNEDFRRCFQFVPSDLVKDQSHLIK